MPGRPNGSPSSRFPRRPMWPFASANIDSVCASASRSRRVSRSDQGSTANGECAFIRRSSSSARSATTTSAPAARSASGSPVAVDADDEAEAARAPGGHAGKRVLEHGRLVGLRRREPRPRRETRPAPACRASVLARVRRRRRAARTDRRCRPLRGRPRSWRWTRRRPAAGRPARAARTKRTETRRTARTPSRRISSRRARSSLTERSRLLVGSLDPPGGEERAYSVAAWLSRRRSGRSRRREGDEPLAAAAHAAQEVVERPSTPPRAATPSASARRRGRTGTRGCQPAEAGERRRFERSSHRSRHAGSVHGTGPPEHRGVRSICGRSSPQAG